MLDKSSPALSIKNLCKTYRTKTGTEKTALSDVSLTVPRGAFFALLGPNGAGKSTLINIISGIVLKTSGSAEVCGFDIERDMRAARRALGVVPQELILDPFFPAYEVLENTAGFYGVPKEKRRSMEIIEALGLKEKAFSPARSLSGGMRRRLLVAKALVHTPEVLILDEPTAGVDVELRTQLWDYVRELNRRGTTILLTTHYLEEAEALCDHIAVINHGKIIANDSKKNLMQLLDHKTLTITFAEPLSAVPENLQQFSPSLQENGTIVFAYQRSQVTPNKILDAINQSHLTIRDLSTKEPDLEDVFRHLTG
jgi:ABC-2 type transport system ATP-binding protein